MVTVLFVAAGIALGLFVVFRVRDPRLLRNGVFLVVGLGALVFGMLALGLEWRPTARAARTVLLITAIAVPVSILLLGIALIANGVTMLRREGRSLGNQLSLLTGVAVILVPVVTGAIMLHLGIAGLIAGGAILVAIAYVSVAFTGFAAYSVVYSWTRDRGRHDAIVVHGACLRRDGTVTPLLRGRLDRGIRAYRAALERGENPVMVPSGGKGPDESRAEAAAMAAYLAESGIPADDILLEDRSRNTEENIRNSIALLGDSKPGRRLLLVTSDYHVLRTASLARRLGVDAQVVGSRTARYFVPSAFLREFIAVLTAHRLVTVIALSPLVLIVAAAILRSLQLAVVG